MKLCMGCMKQIDEQLLTCPYCGFNETTLKQESYYLAPGTIVGGKYIIGRVLSYGGHTISYLGMDAEANRRVNIKEYLPSDFSTRSEGEKEVTIYSGDGQAQFEQGLTNFLNEANRIEHLTDVEGIAKIYDCIAENDTGYVVSEYVEGRTLKEILDSGEKYSVEEARAFIIKILKGLAKVHRLNIVHCDISPETIMVTDSGDIKLLDFGATRYVTTANSKSLSVILKRGYAPEEQYRSRGVRGPWTDVYALGAVMYRMITGTIPQESVERVLVDELKELSKKGISISENVENALMNALNVYQEERTQSAEAFLKELTSKSVKRIKVKKRKNKIGKFPVWAKGLVACLFCLVIAGGALLYQKMSASDVDGPSRDVVAIEDFTNKSVKEAEESIDELNKEKGWDIKLAAEDYIFDLNAKDGVICNQSVEAATDLSAPESFEGMEDLKRDDNGKVTGTVKCTVYSNKKLHYGEISDLNAYALAKKLDIDTEDEAHFKKVEKENANYYDLVKIETKDETISGKELKDKSNADKEISYDKENMVISYYASDFFYWKSLDSFEGKNIDDLPDYETYEMASETKREKTGKKKSLKGTNLVDDSYCTFSDEYREGQIVRQTKEEGAKLDTREGLDEALLYVIGEKITYAGETGAQVKAKINGNGATVKYAGSCNSSHKVTNVSVRNSEGKTVSYFKKGQPLTVIITTEAPVIKKTPDTKAPNTKTRKKKPSKKKSDQIF